MLMRLPGEQMKINRTYTSKPFLSWPQSERDDFLRTVETAVKNRTMLILGDKRCFLCGAELGPVTKIEKGGVTTQLGPTVIINTCERCFSYKHQPFPGAK
jgi:hypothetical protein